MSVSPSIGLLVRLSVQAEKRKNKRSRCLSVGVEVGLWMGVGCLCPPIYNDIVTPRENENEREKESKTRGYNIVADRWTEASDPHPHPNPNPHTQALFYSDGQIDQQTDGWTDGKFSS